jgi:mannosyltransferase
MAFAPTNGYSSQYDCVSMLPNIQTRPQFENHNLSNDRLKSWMPIVLILIVATGLRCYQLGTESLWVDEQFSIRDARSLKLGTRPLYYLLLHLWMKLGTSDAWLRLLSIPFSLGSVFLTYLLARRLVSEFTARLAALLMAISPLCIGYAQEIRMYSLSLFLTLLGTLTLAHCLERPRGINFGAWTLWRLLAILTTPLNVTLLLPDMVVFGWRFRRQKRWLLALGLGLGSICLLSLPFLQVLKTAAPRFFESWVAYQAKPDILTIPSILTSFTAFWPLTDLTPLSELHFHPTMWGRDEISMFFYMGYTSLLLCLVGLGMAITLKRPQPYETPDGLVWIALWGVLPAAFLLAVSYLFASIWEERYLLLICPYILILLAHFLIRIWHHYRQIAIVIAAVYVVAVSGGLVHYYTTLYHDNWRGIAQLIQTNEKPGDVIGVYARDWELDLTVPRYYQGTAPIHQLQLEPPKNPKGAQLDRTQQKEKFTPDWFHQQLSVLPPTKSRYWIIVYLPWNRVMQLTREAIKTEFHLLDYRTFPNSVNAPIEVFLVEPRSTESVGG